MSRHTFTPDIDILKTKFWQRKHFSQKFENITEEDIKRIKESATAFREKVEETISQRGYFCMAKTTLYQETLRYLVSPTIGTTLPTFDERLVFLIYTLDPELKISELYMKAPYPTKHEFDFADEETQTKLNDKKLEIDHIIASLVTEEVGITDPYLNFFERIFYNKKILPTTLQKNITSNYVDELLSLCRIVRHFTTVTPEEYEHAIQIAQNYLAQFEEQPNAQTIAYNLIKQNKLVGGNNTLKQIAMLFVMLVDPELNMLKIYYDESMYQKMEERSLEELGFYNPELIRLQVEHHRTFTPEKKISEWQI